MCISYFYWSWMWVMTFVSNYQSLNYISVLKSHMYSNLHVSLRIQRNFLTFSSENQKTCIQLMKFIRQINLLKIQDYYKYTVRIVLSTYAIFRFTRVSLEHMSYVSCMCSLIFCIRTLTVSCSICLLCVLLENLPFTCVFEPYKGIWLLSVWLEHLSFEDCVIGAFDFYVCAPWYSWNTAKVGVTCQ